MWALVKNGAVVDKSEAPHDNITANKRELNAYRWINITAETGSCEIGDAFNNDKFLGPINFGNVAEPFTAYYAGAEHCAIKSTTSYDYVDFLSLTTDELEDGLYRVSWAYMWNFNHTGGNFWAQLLHNDTEIYCHTQEPNEAGGTFFSTGSSQNIPVSYFKTMRLDGVQTFKLRYASGKKNVLASMWDGRIDIQRVGK
jgi:hypothetical protein